MISINDTGRSRLWRLLLGLILAQIVATGVWALNWKTSLQDLFIFYSAGTLGNSGKNPYDIAAIKGETEKNHDQAGRAGDADYLLFFNPPEALVFFSPLARIPWKSASWIWLSIQTVMALGLATLTRTFGAAGQPRWLGLLFVSVVLLNPLTYRLLALGQGTMILAASIALGQWAFESKRPLLGTFLWSLSAFKPHMAIPFLIVAFLLGGWRRLTGIVLTIGFLNILGCLMTTGTLHTIVDFVRFVSEKHLIGFNSVERDQVCSWNRVVYVLGGPKWELKAPSMVAGYFFWTFVFWLRHGRPALAWWNASYLAAMAAVSSIFCALSHGYDFIMLSLMTPLIFERYRLGQRWEASSIVGLIAFTTIPRAVFVKANDVFHFGPQFGEVLLSYRAIVLAVLAIYLFVRGQTGLLNASNLDNSPTAKISPL